MKQALLTAFERDITACIIETSEEIIEVYEGEDLRSYIKTKNDIQDTHFQLNNLTSQSLTFVAIDSCILSSSDPSRCDFLIGNFEKLFFVEIKNRKKNQNRDAKLKAIKQLESSIEYLKTKIVLPKNNLIAVICLVKNKEVYPRITSSLSGKKVDFKNKYNAELMVGQSANF
jgi:hypothetical protein